MTSATLLPTPPVPASGAAGSALALDRVCKTYGAGDSRVEALRDLSMTLDRGSYTAVMGPSGSGKSTFLHCAAGLDRPTTGTVRLEDVDLAGLGEDALARLRRTRIGFVFQSFNLIASLTAAQNVTLPLRLAGRKPDRERLAEIMRVVGLENRQRHRPAELSGGQQQRVAIARALIAEPAVVFADEPTGALDTRSARDVLALLRSAVDELGQMIVMVTHDPVAAAHADAVTFLADGRLVDAMTCPTADRIADRMTRLED
jgi:putative ABC transport system ATP-binding protein